MSIYQQEVRLMSARPVWVAGLVALLACGTTPAKEQPGRNAAAVAAEIDRHLAKRWTERKVEPAAVADDAEFLRRVYLDIAGRIPSVEEARSFLGDKRPDRRARLVERLLGGTRYVNHFTNVWRGLLLPEAGNNFQVRLQQGTFEAWLKQKVAKNDGYDRMVRELLTANVGGGGGNPLAALTGFTEPGPQTFYLAKEFKAENLAASTARVFLGVSVECAQCHNHPFAEWKKEQFWGFAAFFSGIQSQRLMDFLIPSGDNADKHELTLPGTEKVIQAKFLSGAQPEWKSGISARSTLADWITSPTNPYFSKALVNRMWAYFFGTGLVEPIDEMVGATSVSHHPELLDLLAKEFAAHEFDIKFLIATLTATRAYQLTSAGIDKAHDDPTLFMRMPLRALKPEQLFDSVAMATGYRDSGGGDDLISGLLGGNRSARSEFLTRFTSSEKAIEAQTSILHALSLMNGKVIAAATTLENSETLAAVVDAPFSSAAERVEALYLATLSRKPTAKELDRAARFVQEALKPAKEKGKREAYSNALADVFWALLNSPEFVLNH
jgi:hypothetical protein